MDNGSTTRRLDKGKASGKGMPGAVMEAPPEKGKMPGEGDGIAVEEAPPAKGKMPGEGHGMTMKEAPPAPGGMPGEEGMLAALMEAITAEGKMPGEGKGMPGALAEAPAPAPVEKHRVFTKTGVVVSIAALPALGPYTRRGSTANFDVY